MSTWKNFEIQCTDYLNQKFGKYATFTHQGGSNSTVADILVSSKSGKNFYIEVKHSPAQCGQFVLLPDTNYKNFIYSNNNTHPINDFSSNILHHMNLEFDFFSNAGTSGKDIIFENCKTVFYNWINEYYTSKNVKFFITNKFKIIPIDSVLNNFDIFAKYRTKRSGSSSVGKRNSTVIQEYIKNDPELNKTISTINLIGNKLFVSSNKDISNMKLYYGNSEYMFALRDNNYELRRLSNTHNSNVIFSIKLKNSANGISDAEFIEYIN